VKQKFKHIVLIGMLVVMLIPFIYQLHPILNIAPLSGISKYAEKPTFTKKNYFQGTYQEGMNAYLNEKFGLRSVLIRVISQIRFSFFSCTKAPGVVIGKNDEFYIESYIDEYIGKNYRGFAAINKTVQQIKKVQDSLRAINVDLLVVFAPGKASYRAENIPYKYIRIKKDSTNYKTYVQLFKKQGVNFLDLNQSFIQNKGKYRYPVFPKNGAHWSHYGMCIGLDSILKRIESYHHIDLPDIEYSTASLDNKVQGTDNDISILMNLKWELSNEVMPYPNYRINEGGKEKADVLVVGDSYWWCLVGDNLPSRFFKRDEYWFYNKDIVLDNKKKDDKTKYVNLFQQIRNRRTVVLIATEATYYLFPYGFTERLEKLLDGDAKAINEIIEQRIKLDAKWFEQVQLNAKMNQVSLEKQLYRDAKYTWQEENGGTDSVRSQIRRDIYSNTKWLNEIKEKAKKEKRSLEEQAEIEIDFIVKEEYKTIYKDYVEKEKEPLESIINRIRLNAKWLKYVEEKGAKENHNLEEQLQIEAKFIQNGE
jgi:hypothetical protein